MTKINRQHRRMFESTNRKHLQDLDFSKRSSGVKQQINQDDNLQSRWLTNLNNFTVKIEANKLFNDYVKARLKKPIETNFILPYQSLFIEHAYFILSNEENKEMHIRQSFDEDDLNDIKSKLMKGTN